MNIGREVINGLMNGCEYQDILGQKTEEIEKIEKTLAEGDLPSVFRLHSKEMHITPRTPEEYLTLLNVMNMRKSKNVALLSVVERVMRYPIEYYPVKKRVAEIMREVSKDYMEKNKRLEQPLFKSMICIVSKCTKAFSEAVIIPWLTYEQGMSKTAALIFARVIMKSRSEKKYMEEFIEELMEQERTHSLYTLLMSVLIKKISLTDKILYMVKEYLLNNPNMQSDKRFLAWNNLVLVFVREYKSKIDLSALLDVYTGNDNKIETEIRKELAQI